MNPNIDSSPVNDLAPGRPRRVGGFTLVELMVVVVIVAVLATIALASYSWATTRARRAAVQSHMQDIASRQEQLLLDARAYAGSAASPGLPPLPEEVNGHYTVAVTADNAATPPSFLITATPAGSQASSDTRCATLTLDQAGTRTESGSGTVADCW